VLAGLLAERPPAGDLDALRRELDAATRTSARVGRVLEFYAGRLSEPDRYLLAAVSLFTGPVPTAAVLAVARHDAFADRLAGWTPAMVQAAVHDRLGGLVSWHPDGTISAHPLVHDTFRPLVMEAAEVAAQTALTGLSEGAVNSQADARRVVEAIELLVDAGQWEPADSLYRARCDNGEVWEALPAARLGQRAAIAFVGTPARRDACAARLDPRRRGFYLNEVGLCAADSGDLVTAREYLSRAVRHERDASDMVNLSSSLVNLAACLGDLGETALSRDAAAEALIRAPRTGRLELIRDPHTWLGWLAGLTGDTAEAETQFAAADRMQVADDPAGNHLFGLAGAQWAEWLARTGRPGPARALTDRNREICREQGWNARAARCDRLLGRLALTAGDTTAAGKDLTAAAGCFRDGDFTELSITLADLADYALAAGDPEAAERHATEAITIAGPRGLVPAQSAALATRARIRASQAAATTSPDHLAGGRDAADAALRLAIRHHLAWHELDALRAHVALDQAEGSDHQWAARAEILYGQLVPPGLDPDPLTTIERLVATQKAAELAAGAPASDAGNNGK